MKSKNISKFCKIAKKRLKKLKQLKKIENKELNYVKNNIDFPWSVPYNYSTYLMESSLYSEKEDDLYWQNQTQF